LADIIVRCCGLLDWGIQHGWRGIGPSSDGVEDAVLQR
jgi:hypothetical protein